MLKLGINHCDCGGLMSTCKASNNIVNQQLCDYNDNPTNSRCISLRKDLNNHCDNPAAQHESRHGRPVKPLTEVDVFDIRNRDTYPDY